MAETVYIVAVIVLAAVGLVFMRLSKWSAHEAAFWYRVGALVRFAPEENARYQSLLRWAQQNPLPWWRRLGGWRSPQMRRDAAR